MSREEAKNIVDQQLSELLSNPLVTLDERYVEAERMAIKALEQEPCDDCISRQAVLDEMYKRQKDGDAITAGFIKNLPSVTPQQKMGRWIYDKKEDSYKCSLCTFPCHKDNLGAIPTKYCAGCGAVMEVWNDD